MMDSEFLRILITFLAGAGVALVGAAVNHLFSMGRWSAERREREVADLYDNADKHFSLSMAIGRSHAPVAAGELPVKPVAVVDKAREELKQINSLADDVISGIRRAPEPVTDHLRLFNDRMFRASNTIPYDIEVAKFAIREYRAALDDYVRRGRTRAPKLLVGDNVNEYERAAGVYRLKA